MRSARVALLVATALAPELLGEPVDRSSFRSTAAFDAFGTHWAGGNTKKHVRTAGDINGGRLEDGVGFRGESVVATSPPSTTSTATLDAGGLFFKMDRRARLKYARFTEISETAAEAGGSVPGTGRTLAARFDAGINHTCAVLDAGSVRCWGRAAGGQLGYGNQKPIGDDETPDSAGPVDLGSGRTARAISAGGGHTCAVLDDGTVRCWGNGLYGKLGYGNQDNIGDNETPASVGTVNLGTGRTATAIATGGGHTCALLDAGTVRCWGHGLNGQLGYGNKNNIGDDETPGSVGPVDLGAGRTATAIAAGLEHTCAILDDGTVRCWGNGISGRLGYSNEDPIGDNETPGRFGPVNLGVARTARAIVAGDHHTCAVLDDGTVRCWGYGGTGQLGYGNTESIGNVPSENPATKGPVDIGVGRTATALAAGGAHTCVLLDDKTVRCWGANKYGRLGYDNERIVGARSGETPGKFGPVKLGPRTVTAITAGGFHTCAVLDDGTVRCWGDGSKLGYGFYGRPGYYDNWTIGTCEPPPPMPLSCMSSLGPVSLGGLISVAPGPPSGRRPR